MKIKIIKYTSKYKSQLIDLLKYKWTDSDEEQRRERFEWRYENNPYSTTPFAYLAIYDEKLIGFRALVCQKVKYNDKELLIFSPADAIVHPNYRRKGIFSKITASFINDIHELYPGNSIIINLSSNLKSTLGCLKQGWQETNGLVEFCVKISLFNYLKSKLLNTSIDKNENISKNEWKGNYQIELSSAFDNQKIANFLNKHREPCKITNIRDIPFLKWKYTYQQEKYICVYYYQNKELVGYCIIKRNSKINYSLEEYFCADYQHLKRIINFACKNLSIPLLRALAVSKHQSTHLRGCGLIKEPKLFLKILKIKRLPVIVRPTIPNPEEKDFFINGTDIRNIENWLIYKADIH